MATRSSKSRGVIPSGLLLDTPRPRKFIMTKPKAAGKQNARDRTSTEEPKISSSEVLRPAHSPKLARQPTRKTAHKLIERRRRAKLNEEFDVLKAKLPVSLHGAFKLEIIQVSTFKNKPLLNSNNTVEASIAYIDDLQNYVAKLEGRCNVERLPPIQHLLKKSGASLGQMSQSAKRAWGDANYEPNDMRTLNAD